MTIERPFRSIHRIYDVSPADVSPAVLLARSRGDARRWPIVGWEINGDNIPPEPRADQVAAMVKQLCDKTGLDTDLLPGVAALYSEWLETPGHRDEEIEAALINIIDAAVDEHDRRHAAAR